MEDFIRNKNNDKTIQYDYAIPIETGCVGHLMAFQIAMKKGINVLDGDGAGRAYPKMSMNTFAESNIPVGPLSLVTGNPVKKGGTDILLNIEGAGNVDELFRNIIGTEEFHNVSSTTCFTMKGKQIKKDGAIIKNTIKRAKKLGKILRKTEKNVVEKVIEYLEKEFDFAKVLIDGKVSEINQKVQGGFDVGVIKIKNKNHEIEILNLNENIIAWSNDKSYPIALGPDLICYMDKNGNVYSNPDLTLNQELVVIGVKAAKGYNTEYIQNLFKEIFKDLNYFGPYTPIDVINK
jgi:hypothetical protein